MTVMTFMLEKTSFSLIGVSVAGGVSHNIGQLIIAMLIVQNASVFVYAPALLVAGVAAGVVIGGLTNEIFEKSSSITLKASVSEFIIFQITDAFFNLLLYVPVPG